MTRDNQADDNDRHELSNALGKLERAAEHFRALVFTADFSHGAAVDLTADADELAHQLDRLTRAQVARE
jgi:hypothetical protein